MVLPLAAVGVIFIRHLGVGKCFAGIIIIIHGNHIPLILKQVMPDIIIGVSDILSVNKIMLFVGFVPLIEHNALLRGIGKPAHACRGTLHAKQRRKRA